MQQDLKKIVVIGPESTGKSTLAEALARHFATTFVPEYARIYLEQLPHPYHEEDLLIMAKGQLTLEDNYALEATNNLLFCDTDLYVIKVWSEDKYNRCRPEILQEIASRKYDLYLLTGIDMPWQDDPLREHPQPEMRQYFYNIYLDIVQQSGVPFIMVEGSQEERLKIAVGAVKGLCWHI